MSAASPYMAVSTAPATGAIPMRNQQMYIIGLVCSILMLIRDVNNFIYGNEYYSTLGYIFTVVFLLCDGLALYIITLPYEKWNPIMTSYGAYIKIIMIVYLGIIIFITILLAIVIISTGVISAIVFVIIFAVIEIAFVCGAYLPLFKLYGADSGISFSPVIYSPPVVQVAPVVQTSMQISPSPAVVATVQLS